jgi:hypothetical protein
MAGTWASHCLDDFWRMAVVTSGLRWWPSVWKGLFCFCLCGFSLLLAYAAYRAAVADAAAQNDLANALGQIRLAGQAPADVSGLPRASATIPRATWWGLLFGLLWGIPGTVWLRAALRDSRPSMAPACAAGPMAPSERRLYQLACLLSMAGCALAGLGPLLLFGASWLPARGSSAWDAAAVAWLASAGEVAIYAAPAAGLLGLVAVAAQWLRYRRDFAWFVAVASAAVPATWLLLYLAFSGQPRPGGS